MAQLELNDISLSCHKMSDDRTYATRLNTNASARQSHKTARIELFVQGKLTTIERDELPYYLGRDENDCDMTFAGERISRRHCTFQIRDNQIGLLDTSTNGTYIKLGRAESLFIHNDFYPLIGQGAIQLGQRVDLDDSDIILYKVVTSD